MKRPIVNDRPRLRQRLKMVLRQHGVEPSMIDLDMYSEVDFFDDLIDAVMGVTTSPAAVDSVDALHQQREHGGEG